MCGLTGFLTTNPTQPPETLQRIATDMADALVHRGPDDGGIWVDADAGIALGHRRLSIIDLSPLGHQPMVSHDGRFVLTFNGEVYNYAPIRAELEAWGYPFKGHSDTEVLLAGICRWGLEETLRRSNGMFAIAVWDRKGHVLSLARDRSGKKPLYYGWANGTFVFGSELKALHRHPAFTPEIDRDALALYLRYTWMPVPHTIYRGIRQLPAATILEVRPDATAPLIPKAYWSSRDVAEAGARAPLTLSPDAIADRLDATLREAVALRMVADVPVGAFLSGGIDSSVVVALMQAQSPGRVRTFTIGFEEQEYNEAEHAKAVARHLGTDHEELYVSPADCMAVIPNLPTLYDEPLGDYSQVPTYLVSALARRHVTVSLSGDGGDELFAGYNSYPRIYNRWMDVQRQWAACPPALRAPLAGGLNRFADAGIRFLEGPGRAGGPLGRKVMKRLRRIQKRGSPTISAAELYARDRERYAGADTFVVGARPADCLLTQPQAWAQGVDPLLAMQQVDFATYMVDDVLVKVDRASMGTALEVRCPLLDTDVIAFAWSLPPDQRLGPTGGKAALRRVLARYVPEALFDRPKQGFGLPVDRWMRGPLREWVETLLDERRLAREGYLQPAMVRRTWAEHLSEGKDHTFLLWSLLMFQAWQEHWTQQRAPLESPRAPAAVVSHG